VWLYVEDGVAYLAPCMGQAVQLQMHRVMHIPVAAVVQGLKPATGAAKRVPDG
jgi:hypothetical protein